MKQPDPPSSRCLSCTGNVPVNSKTAHPHPQANPGAFDFFEKFWSNSPLCCQFRGQMPHPLELQRGSNPPPCHAMLSWNKRIWTESLTFGNKFCKIFRHYGFLVQLVFAPHFKQTHILRYNYSCFEKGCPTKPYAAMPKGIMGNEVYGIWLRL